MSIGYWIRPLRSSLLATNVRCCQLASSTSTRTSAWSRLLLVQHRQQSTNAATAPLAATDSTSSTRSAKDHVQFNHVEQLVNAPKSRSPQARPDFVEYRNKLRPYGEGQFVLEKDNETGIALVTIDQPRFKNAISGKMAAQFDEVLSELENWKEGKAVIIRGRDGFFSSGGDQTTVRDNSNTEAGRVFTTLWQDNLTRLESLRLMTVALIEGKALGLATELCYACDFRLATPSAQMGYVQIRLAITAVAGGGSRLVKLIGKSKALRMMASGKIYPAQVMLDWGALDEILPVSNDKDLDGNVRAAREWLAPYTAGASVTLRAIKGIVYETSRVSPHVLDREIDFFLEAWGQKDHREAQANSSLKHMN